MLWGGQLGNSATRATYPIISRLFSSLDQGSRRTRTYPMLADNNTTRDTEKKFADMTTIKELDEFIQEKADTGKFILVKDKNTSIYAEVMKGIVGEFEDI